MKSEETTKWPAMVVQQHTNVAMKRARAQGREDLEWEISDDPLPILLNYLRDQNVDEYEPSTIYYDPAERRIVLEQ